MTRRVRWTLLVAALAFGLTAARAERAVPAFWQPVPDLPHAVRYAAAAPFDGRIFVFGGTGAAGTQTGYTQLFDPVGERWSLGADMPEPADYVTAVATSRGIHVLGGARSGVGVLPTHRLYDPASDSWSTQPDVPIALDGASAVAIGDQLYLFGGVRGGRAYSNAAFAFDLDGGEWRTLAPIPGARISPTAVVAGDNIHLFGGGVPQLATTREHLIYDPRSDSWSYGPPLPQPRETLGAGRLAGLLCVFGGRLAAAGGRNMPMPDTWCFDSRTGEWVFEDPLPTPRAELAFATLGNALYAIGGHDDSGAPSAVVERLVLPVADDATIPAAAQASDPYRSAGVHCSEEDVPTSRVRFRIEDDLDLDGVPDYLLAMAPCGNAGCNFFAVLSSDGYRPVGSVFVHPLAARVAPAPPRASRVTAYVRQNAERGRLVTYELSSDGVETVEAEPMRPTGADQREYEALFAPDTRARAERGVCADAAAPITWTPY